MGMQQIGETDFGARGAKEQSLPDSSRPSEYNWTTRPQVEMAERIALIKKALYVNSLAQGRTPDQGKAADVVAISCAYAVESIPTLYLAECLRRAVQGQTDDFLLTAAAVNRAYDDMLPELQHRARMQAGRALPAPPESECMGAKEFRERHNLPESWRPTQPIPKESDLYQSPKIVRGE